MNEQEFNLLDEQWICVLTDDLKQKEVSLTDVFENAHTYRCLSGELRSQDAAILRLLLAVLHTVFSRYDVNGAPAPIKEYDDALERWQSLWELGHFPFEPIKRYLAEWKHRFWLFDPERPFYQVKTARAGTEYSASKLNGQIAESEHQKRLFQAYSKEEKEALTYPQAARWLLNIMACDDSSAKVNKKELIAGDGESPTGIGWLGKIGTIYALGDNLFRTLMLNLVMLRDGEELWEEQKPIWELKEERNKLRIEIPIPQNPAELLTLQSRRIKLYRKNDRVFGYSLVGGDVFTSENAFTEQMTAWRLAKEADKGGAAASYMPKRHDKKKQLWRGFLTITSGTEKERRPGLIAWLCKLREYGLLSDDMLIRLNTVLVTYTASNGSIDDVIADSLDFSISLLGEISMPWQAMIGEQITLCDKLAKAIDELERRICLSESSCENNLNCFAADRLYSRFDHPFRMWLRSLNSQSSSIEDVSEEWHTVALRITRQLGEELVEDSGCAAFTGRSVTKDDKQILYSAPDAYNKFIYTISKL